MIVKNVSMKGIKELFLIGCTHIGNAAAHEGGRAKFMELVKNCHVVWCHLGDSIEAIMPNDARFSISNLDDDYIEDKKDKNPRCVSLLAQADFAAEWLKERKDNCLGMLTGNHEEKASRLVGNISKLITKHAGIPYLSPTAGLTFKFELGESVVFLQHPHINLNSNVNEPERAYYNKVIGLRNKLKAFRADLHCIAHLHRAIVAEPVLTQRMFFENGSAKYRWTPISVDQTWYISLPSLFLTYDSKKQSENYAEVAGYGPTDIGWFSVVFEKNGDIPVVKQWDENGKVIKEFSPKRY